jgi:hypothetical protein
MFLQHYAFGTPGGAIEARRNPKQTIENFFEFVHLHEAKQMLRENLELLTNRSYPHLPDSIEHDDTILFFEKIEKLIEAIHALHTRKIDVTAG